MKHRLFWPVVTLVTLILINTIARSQFASITVRDGRLYGALIDILRQSAPLMLVSLGMTIVIATRGIDLSVGGHGRIRSSGAHDYRRLGRSG